MPPREERDMSQYATKNMIWIAVMLISLMIGGFSKVTTAQVKELIGSNNQTVKAFNDGQNTQIESHRRRLDKVEEEQHDIREVISNFKIENAKAMGDIKGLLNKILIEAKK